MGNFRLFNLVVLLAEGGGKTYHLYNDVPDLKVGHKEHHIVPHPSALTVEPCRDVISLDSADPALQGD